jgi:hypothetical protein
MDSLKKNYCPVCGYDLGFPAWTDLSPSDEICPSCGIQFGYEDAAGGDIKRRSLIYQQWRIQWIQKGMPWNSLGIEPPNNWDPKEQLKNLNK